MTYTRCLLLFFLLISVSCGQPCDMECWLKQIVVNIPNQSLPINKLVSEAFIVAVCSLQGATGYVNVTNMVCSQVELGSITSGILA